MSFRAKYDGTCARCSESITEGDLLEWADEGVVVHVGCAAEEKLDEKRPTCSKCWQVLSVSGACGCDPE